MSDPDLIERVAQASFQGGWHAAHPDVRADWRGAVAAIIGAYETDRDRPWPRVNHPTQRDLDRMTGQP